MSTPLVRLRKPHLHRPHLHRPRLRRPRLRRPTAVAAAVLAMAGAVALIAVPASAGTDGAQVTALTTPAPDPSASPPSPPPDTCSILSTVSPTVSGGPRPTATRTLAPTVPPASPPATPPATGAPVTSPPIPPTPPITPTPSPCPGAISGRILDAGVGIGSVGVELLPAEFNTTLSQVFTDASGAFRFDGVQAGRYRLKYVLPGGFTQYVPRQTIPFFGGIISVSPRIESTVTETVIPHGSMAGRITRSDGAPAPGAVLGVFNVNLFQIATVLADDNGAYEFPYLPGGQFTVYVGISGVSAPQQWAHRHKNRQDADPVTIVVGQRTTLDERLLPVGRISGRVTDGGAAVTGGVVTAYSQAGDEPILAAIQSDGTYALHAYTGSYKVRFEPEPPSLEQWARGKETEDQADTITLTENADVVLNEALLPIGTARGRLTDADGQPVMFAAVQFQDPARDRFREATTDADGNWSAYLRPGTYKVRFGTATQVQWAHDKLTFGAADPVTIVARQTTVVNESLLAPGGLRVTAVEEGTGFPMIVFCATADNGVMLHEVCTENGTVTMDDLGPGTYTVKVSDTGDHIDGFTHGVTVRSGRTTAVTGTLVRAAAIEVFVVDAQTGEPVNGICANTTPVDHPEVPGEGNGGCVSGSSINLVPVKPDRYNLFVSSFDGVHGSQWVGPHGGVGAQTQALVITALPGVTSQLTVRLDGRGTVAGTITDRATGQPIEGALVGARGAMAITDADGRYVIADLGPYPWVLSFGHDDYAYQWSGGGSNRLAATPVRVRVGQTTTHNVKLTKGTTLTGTVTGTGGRPDWGIVTVVNARTFDAMGYGMIGPDGTYVTHVLGPQDVKLVLQATFHGPQVTRWYRDAAEFARSTTVRMPSTGTKRVNLTIS